MNLSCLIFKLHWFCIYTTFILPFIHYYFLLIHILVSLSWYCNDNKCIVSQLEYKFFGNTFLGNGPKFVVPLRLRSYLYINFLIGCLFHIYYESINLIQFHSF